MKKHVAKGGYPFEWLDNLISVKLNPERTNLNEIPENEMNLAENQLSFEIWKLLNHLKVRTFGRSAKKIRAFVTNFHETLIELVKQSKRNMADCDCSKAVAFSEKVIIGLEELQGEVETRFSKYLPDAKLSDAGNDREPTRFKVLCRLSVDQLGILIKAADDIKLILARSMSLIFRSLVPFLSTERIKNISWMSMRKSTYQFEQADLDNAILVLEKMIKKIKEYY